MGLLTYSAKEIHAALVAKNILLLQNIIEMQKKEYKTIPDSVSNELRSLDRLGLSKTKNAAILKDKINKVNAENEEIQKYNDAIDFAKERLEFIAETRKVFGDNVLIVSYEDFEHIIKKYNLVCGLLEQYTGVIPKENIEEFEYTRDILYNDNSEEYRKKYIKCLRLVKNYKDYGIDRFPFCYEVESEYERKLKELKVSEDDFLTRMKLINLYSHSEGFYIIGANQQLSSWQTKFLSKPTDFFIAAPKKDMDFSESFLESLMPKPKDPFICSYTKYGIIVHTKWGEEADDEVLKKYYKQIKALEE